MFQYERLYKKIQAKILDGTYQSGTRLPSIRAMSRSLNLSVTTVLQAYRVLEEAQLIKGKTKSGFYVNANYEALKTQARKLEPPKLVSFDDMMQSMLSESGTQPVLRLGLAQPEPDVLPTRQLGPVYRKFLRNGQYRLTDYSNPQGCIPLRSQIACLMLEKGLDVSAQEIVITNGCQQALKLAFQVCCQPQDVVAIESPCYPGVLHIASEMGLRVVEIPSRLDNGIDLTLLKEALDKHQVRVVYLNPTCSNPSGITLDLAHRKALVQLTEQYSCMLIEDDTNGELLFGNNKPALLKTLSNSDNVIYCSSFSKTIDPGMRVGWMIPGGKLSQVLGNKYVDDLGGAALQQYVLAEFINSKGYFDAIRRAKKIHEKSVRMMLQHIDAFFPKPTLVTPPSGGFLLWVQLPQNVEGNKLRQSALKAGISIAPGTMFSNSPYFNNCIRIGWGGRWNQKIADSIKVVGDIAHALQRSDEVVH